MLSIKRILFPTDFSDCAENAFGFAAHLAAASGAEMHVLHVISDRSLGVDDPLVYFPLDESDVENDLHIRVEDRLEKAVKARSDDHLPIVSAHIRRASAAVGILDYAREFDIDLVVMGTHGRRGVGRIVLGSQAEKVVREAECPVLTVRQQDQAAGIPTIRRIVATIDFSESCETTVRHATALAKTVGARVILLHSIEEANLPGIYGIDVPVMAIPEIRERSRTALKNLAERAGDPEVEYDFRVVEGYPARQIVDALRSEQADMLVIATHGRTGLKHAMLGSVTEKVVRNAHCPVITIKSYGKSLIGGSVTSDSLQEVV